MSKKLSALVALLGAVLLGLPADGRAAAPPKKKPKKNVVRWLKLEAGMAKAKSSGKAAVLVFAEKRYKGPATFEGDELFKALTDSGAVPVKLSPPGRLRVPRNADAEKAKKLREAHAAAEKQYQELVAKYRLRGTPAMVFLAPEGDFMWSACNPSAQQVKQIMAGLAKIVEQFKAAKAKAQENAPPPAKKPEEKKADEKKADGKGASK